MASFPPPPSLSLSYHGTQLGEGHCYDPASLGTAERAGRTRMLTQEAGGGQVGAAE